MPRNVNPINDVPFGQEKTRAEFLARAAWEYDQASRLRSARPIGYQALVEGHERAARAYEKAAKDLPTVSRPAGPVAHARKKTRSAHATKARSKTSDKINIDQLAKMFDLPDWDKIDEMNQQHYSEMSRGAEDEESQIEAERAAQDEVYGQWYDAVESTASQLFEEHGLELEPTGKQGTPTRRYDFKIVPQKSWDDAADKIRETINGVGYFHSDNLKEFLRSGPYTAREAVLSHLGHIKSYPAVYGSGSPRTMYERAWR